MIENTGIEKNKMNHETIIDSCMPREPEVLPNHPIWAIRYMQEEKFQRELEKIYKDVEF